MQSLIKERLLEIVTERSQMFYRPKNVDSVIRFFNKHVKYSELVRSAWFFLWLDFSWGQAVDTFS